LKAFIAWSNDPVSLNAEDGAAPEVDCRREAALVKVCGRGSKFAAVAGLLHTKGTAASLWLVLPPHVIRL